MRGEITNNASTGNAVQAFTSGTGAALFAQGTMAGMFNGNVQINGNLTVTGTKSGFQIDDPRAPTLRTLTHSPVETDGLTVVYTGNTTTGKDGLATVKLPSYATTIAKDWRYGLTAIGKLGQVIVAHEVHGGAFVIRSQHPDTKVSWSVTGTRIDPQAKAAPIVAVAAKTGSARGRYLNPTLYGKPASLAVTPPLLPTAPASTRAAKSTPRLASSR